MSHSPIDYALANLRHRIPEPILQMFFGPQPITQSTPSPFSRQHPIDYNIDYGIYEKILLSRVHPDINLFGATQVVIDLSAASVESIDYSTRVYRIPYESTSGRRIVSAQSLHYKRYLSANYNSYLDSNTNQLEQASNALINSLGSIPVVQTANLQIIGDNVVMVRDNAQFSVDDFILVAIVEFDEALSAIAPGAYPVYASLVEYATKAYIYINGMIQLDRGQLYAGMELGQIRNFIEEYRDAEEEYQRIFKENWHKAAFTSDRMRMHKYVRGMFGSSV